MTAVCHLWPSISPWNIWDLPYNVWTKLFAPEADAWIAAQRKAAG